MSSFLGKSAKTGWSRGILSKVSSKAPLLIFGAIFGAVGVSIIMSANAATSKASIEPEDGSRSGVTLTTTTSASGGQAIKFGALTQSGGTTQFGMSAPDNLWNQRLADVGGPTNIHFRRIFIVGFDDSLTKVQEAISDNMIPIISWKVTPYSWAQVGAGQADADLNQLVTRLNAIPGPKHLVLHHEPAGDGTAADYVAMQTRALPILKTAQQATVGVIANGWWWSARSQGYTDAEINDWLPNSVINLCDVVAADTYQDETLNEDGSVKAQRMADWARRKGNVDALGIGEFNGWTAASITNVMNTVKAESALFRWALVWNSGPAGLGTPLEGDRLDAFKAGLATQNPT